jgi:predicted GNAT family acetyltransferase
MKIEIKENGNKGFAIASIEGEKVGLMSYNISSSEFILIDHTEVEEAFKGKSVGKALLYKIVDMAREKNIKIFPLCPFASAMFKKFDDIKDVLKS